MSGEFVEHPLKGSNASITTTKSYDGRWYVTIVIGPFNNERVPEMVTTSFVQTMTDVGVRCRIDEGRVN